MIIDEYTNSELEEMGIPLPCECLNARVGEDRRGNLYLVCEDCGSMALMKTGVAREDHEAS